MKRIAKLFYSDKILIFLTICISLISFCYFYFHGQQNLSYGDAISRLNIARKIIDSITPGFGQLGAIWLPFPTVLMIPFIWSDFLWHSGIAGAIISGTAFIFGAVYLKKTMYLITKDTAASLLVWLIFVTNINVLFFQSMAMSESFFLFSVIMTLYFLSKWMLDQEITNYLLAAFFVMLGTLTRYEGYFVLVGSLVTISICLIMQNVRNKNFPKIEGMILLFLSVASYGIFLWCLYCLIFFKNPFHWLSLYSGGDGTLIPSASQQRNLLNSFSSYTQITIWMCGIVVFFLGLIGYLMLIITFIKDLLKKHDISRYLPLITISTLLFFLLIYGYQKGYIPPVDFESITLQHILSKKFDFFLSNSIQSNIPNIRYGIEMLPFIALFVGFFASRARILFFMILLLVVFQIYTNYQTSLLLQFSIPYAARYNILPAAVWFQSHYTGDGLILISDNANEDFMFETGLSYNHFIYEGTREYWRTSLTNPSKYADWVVIQTKLSGDFVYDSMKLTNFAMLKKQFRLVYSDNKGYEIYRRI